MFKKLLTTLSKAGRTSDQSNTYQSQFEVYWVSLVIWIPDTSFPLLMHSVIQSCPQDLVDFDALIRSTPVAQGPLTLGLIKRQAAIALAPAYVQLFIGRRGAFRGQTGVWGSPGAPWSPQKPCCCCWNKPWHIDVCSAWPSHQKSTYSTKTPDYWVRQNRFLR